MISSPAPHSFKHIAHVGVNKDGLFEASKDLDGSWKTMLAELQGHGVSEAVVVRHSDFVEGFWKGVEAIRTVSGSGAERVGGEKRLLRHLKLPTDDRHVAGAAISREMTPVSVM
jgi:neural Wiskott-Aldrich syndrome protein